MQALTAAVALLGRVLLSLIFVYEGVTSIGRYSAVAEYMQGAGVDSRLLPLVILLQLGGGLMVLTGFWARLGALGLAGFCALTAMLFHANWADSSEMIQSQKDLAMAGGFLMLAAFGPGALSLDQWLARRR